MNKKVLIVTYYWPPSGGAGVQRWLYMANELAKAGVECHVLTVDEKYASYFQFDSSLEKDIHPDVHIHKTKTRELLKLYGKLVGKKNVPVSGFSNVDSSSSFQKLANALRSRYFIPDPRKNWRKYALPKAIELIDKHGINKVITTSPPHSVQLIGKAIKQQRKIEWTADFRDPWTDIYYYDLLQHSKKSAAKDKAMEIDVLQSADRILTVSQGFKKLFASKGVDENKIEVVYNGHSVQFDDTKTKQIEENFTLLYAGSIADNYPYSALANLKRDNSDLYYKQFGELPNQLVQKLQGMDKVELGGRLSHAEILREMQKASCLLLLIPETTNNNGIVPGKLFEYMASGTPILAIGPLTGDVASILKQSGCGKLFDKEDIDGMHAFLNSARMGEIKADHDVIEQYSRSNQVRLLQSILWQ